MDRTIEKDVDRCRKDRIGVGLSTLHLHHDPYPPKASSSLI
jgi:hypothetical protein